MNPSRYRLPQHCSSDRLRARAATLASRREEYRFTTDAAAGHPAEGFRLPPHVAALPAGERFSPSKWTRIYTHQLAFRANALVNGLRTLDRSTTAERAYRRLLGLLDPPPIVDRWRSDAEFARQRVAGVNPMAIARCDQAPTNELLRAAELVLASRYATTARRALDAGRLFQTSYGWLLDDRIQRQVTAGGCVLAAPTCLFHVDVDGTLMPIAIQLHTASSDVAPVLTPLDDEYSWLLARAHAQAADAHYHEIYYHLLDTHMVSEVFAICAARRLHPDHPVSQLLAPHFQFNLAIDDKARTDLLAPAGAIASTMAAGLGGLLDLGRLAHSHWSYRERSLHAELAGRGVDDPRFLPHYPYRDDALRIWNAMHSYVDEVLAAWYRTDADVATDPEFKAWLRELSDPTAGGIAGLPTAIETRAELTELVTNVIFRASAQHAAVNNGQFDCYGFVPNASGAVFAKVPDGACSLSAREFFAGLPSRRRSLVQTGMVWVLSEPTHRSLLRSGESPAFAADVCPQAHAAAARFRRRLHALSRAIDERNSGLEVPYVYLDPRNVARSTGT